MKKYQRLPQEEFAVTTETFSGPLHLMLHLIKKHQLNLHDLNLEVLTSQYLQYINSWSKESLDIASEYLHELSGLCEVRSRQLIPKAVVETDVPEEDPQLLLVQRLQRYQVFQTSATWLWKAQQQRQRYLGREISEKIVGLIKVTLSNRPTDLLRTYQQLMKKKAIWELPTIENSLPLVDYSDILKHLRDQISTLNEKTPFPTLCLNDSTEAIACSFATLLQLARQQTVELTQDQEQLWVRKKQ